jgi:hypothetical protein
VAGGLLDGAAALGADPRGAGVVEPRAILTLRGRLLADTVLHQLTAN